MPLGRLKSFGRLVFNAYERRPLVMNGLVGGFMYAAGEVIVKYRTNDVKPVGVAQITTLGALENGLLMPFWYNFLNRAVGSGASTGVVLLKCGLDQVFFSSQQNCLFLGLCAYQHSSKLEAAVNELKKDLFTIWLNDCSIWPFLNFVGFAVVPVKLLPSFMAVPQLVWQVYLSSVDAHAKERNLIATFHDIDADHNCFIDATELRDFIQSRGVNVTSEQVAAMIRDADSMTGQPSDGKVSLEEFLLLAQKGPALATATLWEQVQSHCSVAKGTRSVLQRVQQLDQKKVLQLFNQIDVDKNGSIDEDELRTAFQARGLTLTADELKRAFNDAKHYSRAGISLEDLIAFVQRTDSVTAAVLWQDVASTTLIEVEAPDPDFIKHRTDAIHNFGVASFGLLTAALIRKLVFKI